MSEQETAGEWLDRLEETYEKFEGMEWEDYENLLEVARSVRAQPSFAELREMGRDLKGWMDHWDDIGHFKTGMRHLVNQWRLSTIEEALKKVEHLV